MRIKQNSKFPAAWLSGKGRGRKTGSKEMTGDGGEQRGDLTSHTLRKKSSEEGEASPRH